MLVLIAIDLLPVTENALQPRFSAAFALEPNERDRPARLIRDIRSLAFPFVEANQTKEFLNHGVIG